MQDRERNQHIRTVAEQNAELADALDQLGLAEYIREAGTDPNRTPLQETVLEYVKIGRQADDATLYTIQHTLETWRVIREVPGLHRVVLGCPDTPYGAVGLVRRYHPATDPLSGATPTMPRWLVEEVSTPLAECLDAHDLLEDVVAVYEDAPEVVLSSDDRRTHVHLHPPTDDESTWDVGFFIQHGSESLGSYETPEAAVEAAENYLPRDDGQRG